MTESGSLSTLLPRHLASQALESRARIEGERKVVTLLFADVVGSTAMATDLDPEDLVDVLNGLFSHWVEAVHRYEGTVDKFLGDGMLALFGAPLVHEDDPRRAVLAALEIRDTTRTYASTLDGIPLDVRVGLNTGMVVVGTVGSDARMEYTAIGDPVNVAQRVEASADPGTVFVSEATRRLIEPYFIVRDAGTFELKGKPQPAALCEVVADAGVVGTVRGVEGLTSPLVGRAGELARLDQMLDDLRAGTGSVVALVGEPGLGKSRLIAEMSERAGNLGWAEGHSISFGAATPYLPVVELVGDLDPAPADADLAALVSGGVVADPDGARDRILVAVRRLVASCAPVLVVVEDLHWADDASLDIFEGLAGLAADHPIGLLITSRPEGEERAVALGAEVFAIEPLDHDQHGELLNNLLRIDRIPEAMQDLIIERARGNPFFTEEFLRMLIDEGVLEHVDDEWRAVGSIDEVAVPPHVQGLVASRIDRLDPATKRIVQAASVLGPVFGEALLARLVDVPIDLAPLHAGGFLQAGPDSSSLAFKHGITQEVAYESVLRKTRRDLHRRAALAIEDLYPTETDLRAAELGRHFDLAGDTDRALPYLTAAARRAFGAFSTESALLLSARALELVDHDAARFELLDLRARILGHVGRHEDEWETVEEMTALAAGDLALELPALEAAVRCRIDSDYIEAFPLCERALELSATVGDAAQRGRLLVMWASLQRRQYAPDRAMLALDEAIALFESAGETRLRAAALAELAETLVHLGSDRASDVVGEALAAARDSRDPQLIARALNRSGLERLNSSDPAGALPDLDQAIGMAGDIGDRTLLALSHRRAGYAHAALDDTDAAMAEFRSALDVSQSAADAHGWLFSAMGVVTILESVERFVDLYEWLAAHEAEAAAWGHAHLLAYFHYAIAYRALRWLHRFDEAQEYLEKAVGMMASNPEWIPPAVMYRNGLATVLMAAGRFDESRAIIDQARAIAVEHGVSEDTVNYLRVTDALLAMHAGDPAHARSAVDGLARHVDDDPGERNALEFLSAEVALASDDPGSALDHARAALALEPILARERWFSRIQILELIARATGACGADPGPAWAEARTAADEFLASLPDHFAASSRLRPDLVSILSH
ncbi:MAG: AAA family ATPase [Acidimicrobiia bacterium]|nr:AAA family ATPase [Acidimicrobiia bacterium]